MEHNISPAQLKEASLKMEGRKPLNPIGQCFESALHAYFQLRKLELEGSIRNLRLVHGIGTANMPGQEGESIAHAWLTFERDKELLAFEPTWGVVVPAENVTRDLQVSYKVTYDYRDLVMVITMNNNIDIGPWDSEILKVLGVKQ